MNPTKMAEKQMFPTHGSDSFDGEPDAVKVASPGSAGGMAQTSRSSPAIGGAVPTHSVTVEDYVPPPRARRDCHFCNPEPCRFGPNMNTTDDTKKGETT